MRRTDPPLAGLFLAIVLPLASSRAEVAGETVDFVRDVRPVLVASCYGCHGPQKQKSDYRLDVRQSALRGGSIGGAIVPGHAAQSKLIQYVAGGDPDRLMPPEGRGDRLTPAQVAILRTWIDQGAHWPDGVDVGDVGASQPANHWSLRPLVMPAVPTPRDAGWVRTPIDAFILAKLDENHLSPSVPADRRSLIRRVTFDLTGLPPTPAEIDAFLADATPDAYLRLLDRLLDSPAYGERWARHWLDVVHYADSHGFGMDRPRPNAWPYRDYVVRSFNADKPYARFVKEQIAGDVLYSDDPQATAALGFVAAGPWNQSPIAEQMDDVDCKKIAQVIDRDDMVATTMNTFVSTTVQCARCHDHKFDPVTQREYYNLQAVFAGVDRVDRPYDPDPAVHARRQSLLAKKHDLADGVGAVPTEPPVQRAVAAWEQEISDARARWTTLSPAAVTSTGGATPEPQPDGSVYFGGFRPERDTYTITVRCDLPVITAVRLETLPDDRLPQKGPGRTDNGNITVTEFKLCSESVSLANSTSRPATNPIVNPATRPVAIASATADFDQTGWTSAMSIDGNNGTGWGIYPQVGKPHEVVYALKSPLTGPSILTFIIEQNHGESHLIGRLRLSATGVADLRQVSAPSAAIAAILAVPQEQRDAGQKSALALYVLRLNVERDLAALPPAQKVYAIASDFPAYRKFTPAKTPRPIFVLRRGDIHQPTDLAEPGAIACVPGLKAKFRLGKPNDEGSRRAALAEWVTDPNNGLAWRSAVNRVWQYHFGRGIVDTPGDFGRMGATPTHPELLDWLAVWFRDQGGSMKKLHRLILTSAVYLQSSETNPKYDEIDAGNRYLWRMNRARLEAEAIHDAILAVTGKLDRTIGGPPVDQFRFADPDVEVTPIVDFGTFDVDSPASFRRSLYRRVFRTMPDPLMDALDCPDPSTLTAKRNVSITALQALSMMNNAFVVRQSEHFADRLAKTGGNTRQQIDRAYLLALGRWPSEAESDAVTAYAKQHGMANACRLILNVNEFVFVN